MNPIPSNTQNISKKVVEDLHKNFCRIDKDKLSMLAPEDFFEIPELENNPLVGRVRKVLDRKKDGNVSFHEFIKGLN